VAFENDHVSFRWRDYAHGGKNRVMTVSADEFLRRFLLHVLPKGLVRIRHFGLFANRRRETALARCRELLGAVDVPDLPEPTNQLRCPACSGTMLVIERMTSAQLYSRFDLSLPTLQRCYLDSS
jgi:DNA-directed RNA polymerase subunit RPC12/RpoP